MSLHRVVRERHHARSSSLFAHTFPCQHQVCVPLELGVAPASSMHLLAGARPSLSLLFTIYYVLISRGCACILNLSCEVYPSLERYIHINKWVYVFFNPEQPSNSAGCHFAELQCCRLPRRRATAAPGRNTDTVYSLSISNY